MKQSIDQIIRSKGLKNTWVADKLGITDATLRNWKTKRTHPKISDAERLSELLDVPLSDIDFK